MGVLCDPFRAQISSRLLAGVGRCWYLFVLVVALDSYSAENRIPRTLFIGIPLVASRGVSRSSMFVIVR